jgi:hypothetical protein
MFCGPGCSEMVVEDDATEGIQQTRQLIGVGVRLGKMPQIHDAEGSSKEKGRLSWQRTAYPERTRVSWLILPQYILPG